MHGRCGFEDLHFGTAGIPLSVKKRDTEDGVRAVSELGLSAMELEFVRGVRMGEEKADAVREVATTEGVILTAHGPYYINLNSKEEEKRQASIERIISTAIVGKRCGAFSITFHPAYYQKDSHELVYSKVRDALLDIVDVLSVEENDVWVRPETTGKPSQFGSLEEIISLSEEIEQVLPCIDFSHLHARDGKHNTYEEFMEILGMVEEKLGKGAIRCMHCHVQGINYSSKGELNHLNLRESDFRYVDLLRAFIEFDVAGVVICESPNIEKDALLLKDTYTRLLETES